MRHLTTILFLLCFSILCFGQTKEELKLISKFKSNFLKKAKDNINDTLIIGNFRITGERFYDYRVIKTFDKSKDFQIGEQFYDNIKQLKQISKYDTIGRPIGIAKHYSISGKLQYTLDYDKSEWIVYDNEYYPHYNLQCSVKLKADSLVCKMYGSSFLRNHTLWAIDASFISNEKERKVRWKENLNTEPTKFTFCYRVKLNNQNIYNSSIYFDLDKNGNFIPNIQGGDFFFAGSGFENIPDSLKGSFRLNYDSSLLKAKNLGLKETDSNKAFGQLYWEDFKKNNIDNGQFRFYIRIETKTIENINTTERSTRTTKYDVYSFSPWTGNFIEIKKMKYFEWWNKERSGFSLLEPDVE